MGERLSATVSIQHEESDPICLRASIGGQAEEGFYIVYRGDRTKVLEMLKHVTKAFEMYQHVPEEPTKPHTVKTRFGSS